MVRITGRVLKSNGESLSSGYCANISATPYLVPTFPYCSASSGCEADETKPSPYFEASFEVREGVEALVGALEAAACVGSGCGTGAGAGAGAATGISQVVSPEV